MNVIKYLSLFMLPTLLFISCSDTENNNTPPLEKPTNVYAEFNLTNYTINIDWSAVEGAACYKINLSGGFEGTDYSPTIYRTHYTYIPSQHDKFRIDPNNNTVTVIAFNNTSADIINDGSAVRSDVVPITLSNSVNAAKSVAVSVIDNKLNLQWSGDLQTSYDSVYYKIGVAGWNSKFMTPENVFPATTFLLDTTSLITDIDLKKSTYRFWITSSIFGDSSEVVVYDYKVTNLGKIDNLEKISNDSMVLQWDTILGFPQSSFKYLIYKSNGDSNFSVLDSNLTNTTYYDTTAFSGVTYNYWIKTTTKENIEIVSDTISVHYGTLPTTKPATPEISYNYVVGSLAVISILFNPVKGASSYSIYTSDYLDRDFSLLEKNITLNNPHLTFKNGKLNYTNSETNKMSVAVKITANNSYGSSELSNAIGFSDNWNGPLEYGPDTITASKGVGSTVKLKWNQAKWAGAYKVTKSFTNKFGTTNVMLVVDALKDTLYEDTNFSVSDTFVYNLYEYPFHRINDQISGIISSDSGWIGIDTTGQFDSTTKLIFWNVSKSCNDSILSNVKITINNNGISQDGFTNDSGTVTFDSLNITDSTDTVSVTASLSGYVDTTFDVVIIKNSSLYTTFSLVPIDGCVADSIKTLMLKDTSNQDLMLHLIVPADSGDTSNYDIGTLYGNLFKYPYAERIKKDSSIIRLDTVIVSKYVDSGTYTIYVEKLWSSTPKTFQDIKAKVEIHKNGLNGALEQTISSETATGSGIYWIVGTMDNSGAVTIVNKVTDTEPK